MSQKKQTKLPPSLWKKRPSPDDGTNTIGGRSVRLTPARSSSPIHSKAPQIEESPGSSGEQLKEIPPSSNGTLSEPPLDSQQNSVPIPLPAPVCGGEKTTATPAPHVLPLNASNLSFTSFTSSQLPPSSGSQRIVRNGERMVTNSDEDDDSSSLEDLDDLIRGKEPEKPSKSAFVPLKETEEYHESISDVSKRDSGHKKAARSLPRPFQKSEYKFSLAVLTEQRKQFLASREDVAKVNAMLESRKQQERLNVEPMGMDILQDESVLDKVISNKGGDEENVDRLKDALRRTEALHHDNTWSFFRPKSRKAAPVVFPHVRDDQLRSILQDKSARQQAFLGGYVREYASKKDLPKELLLWIMDMTCIETREDLRLSYVDTLIDAGMQDNSLLLPNTIDRLFQRLGSSEEALNVREAVVPRTKHSSANAEDVIRYLPSILNLIHNLSESMRPDSRAHSICVLCRLLLDHQVIGNCSLVIAIEETLTRLIDSTAGAVHEQEHYKVLKIVYRSTKDPVLRLQLLQNLPAFGFRTAVFRRRLALAFFFHDMNYLKKSADDPMVDLNTMAEYIRNPRFAVNKATDYANFTAEMAILNIGIDSGDPLLPFSVHQHEKRFDNAVDILSTRIKDLSAQIVGTNALNMRRTEAKEVLDSIQRRLSYTVRSRPPPKKSILAEPDHEAEKEAMSGWINSANKLKLDVPLADVTTVQTGINV